MLLRTSSYIHDSRVPWFYGHLWNTACIKEQHNQGRTDLVAETVVLWCPIPLNLIARFGRWLWSFVRYPKLLTNDRADYWKAKYEMK